MHLTVRPGSLPRFARILTLAGLALVVAAAPRPAAVAQEPPKYLEGRPLWDEKDREQYKTLRERESLVRDILNGRAPLDANRAEFQQYFQKQVLMKMTTTSELGKLAERRRDFFKTSFQMTNPPQAVHDALVQMTFDMMRVVVTGTATGQFHPYVRHNAMLIIGDLNEQESTGFGSNRTPPVPFQPALNFMLAQLNDPKQVDEVRMAGLVGILRHAEITRKAAQLNAGAGGNQQQASNQNIIAAALRIAEESNPPAGRSLEGHTWMRRRAIDILIAMGAATGPAADLLEGILSNPDEPISLRCTAAEAVGKMPTSGGQQNFDPAKTAQNVAAIAVEVCKSELSWWEEEQKREQEKKLLNRSNMGGMMMGAESYGSGGSGMAMPGGADYSAMGGPGMYGPGGPEGMYGSGSGSAKKVEEKKKVDPRIDRTQRRLKSCLYYVKLGLDGNAQFAAKRKTPSARQPEAPESSAQGGMLARANAQQKPRVQELSSVVVDMFLAVDKAEPDREKMLTDLRTHLEKLEALAAVNAGGPPAGGPPSGSGGPPGSSGPDASGPPGG